MADDPSVHVIDDDAAVRESLVFLLAAADFRVRSYGSASDFLNVYPHMTTVQGNRFRFRGGDPATVRASMGRLFADGGGNKDVKVIVENG